MEFVFSERTAWDVTEGELARAIRECRAKDQPLVDLTISNPTLCGFHYDPESVLGTLSSADALVYDPDPRGLESARKAVSRYYADHGADMEPESIVLTTSTSEAYSFLFRLLGNPGDRVLAGQPSYPLFEFLAKLDDIQLEPYLLFYDFGWWIDLAELERRIDARTRAIVVVHPNNPTGHFTERPERERLEALCARHGLALIVDEVFLDYALGEAAPGSFAAGEHPCLTFVVSGLSKIAALPQMKVGWIAVSGPEPARREALARLEVIADTFLSLNTPVQLALPLWLHAREAIAAQIRERARTNLVQLAAAGIRHLPVEAGWSVVVEISSEDADPAESSLELALLLVRAAGVITHPGSFYGLSGRNRLVISLIGPTQEFANGVARLSRVSG